MHTHRTHTYIDTYLHIMQVLSNFAYLGKPAKYVLAVLGFHCDVLVKIRR